MDEGLALINLIQDFSVNARSETLFQSINRKNALIESCNGVNIQINSDAMPKLIRDELGSILALRERLACVRRMTQKQAQSNPTAFSRGAISRRHALSRPSAVVLRLAGKTQASGSVEYALSRR